LSELLDACSRSTFQSTYGLFFKNQNQTGNHSFPPKPAETDHKRKFWNRNNTNSVTTSDHS